MSIQTVEGAEWRTQHREHMNGLRAVVVRAIDEHQHALVEVEAFLACVFHQRAAIARVNVIKLLCDVAQADVRDISAAERAVAIVDYGKMGYRLCHTTICSRQALCVAASRF
ncbi:MAG: hypothetical protein BGN85_12205 [Alphaproteobacteria bacterium 64-11]|nr:MAG: hypothetical protein BGN85_12205 [Alphaproteobacteria bacterium 64-11]